MCHYWFEGNSRIETLEVLFQGFNNVLDLYKEKRKEISWYNADFYREDSELIYGLVLLSLQSFINKSCIDFIDCKLFGCKEKYEYYKKESKIIKNEVTQIQLIIALANTFKHKDDKVTFNPDEHTKVPLQKLDLLKDDYRREDRYEYTIIVNGLAILSETININDLLLIVINWYNNIIDISK